MATTTPHTLPAAIGPTHPTYDTYRYVWEQLAHVAEGSGGFLDGTYLIPHPREWEDFSAAAPSKPTKKLQERRTLARYENVAAVILATKEAALFRKPPVRRMVTPAGKVLEDHPYLQWTTDVDGAGHTLDQWWQRTWRHAAVFGHTACVIDRAADDGPTAADKARLLLRTYTPLDMPDWLLSVDGELQAVKLVEALPRTSLTDPVTQEGLRYRVREIDAAQAVTYTAAKNDKDGADRTEAAHGFGVLPVVLLYAHRRAFTPLIGQSALGDPMLYIDLFNLTSEKRELYRKQTFALLNIPLGTASDGQGPAMSVQAAQEMLGQTNGTANVVFSAQPIGFVSPGAENVAAYHEEIQQLLRTIFRITATPYDQDGREAESAESRRLKRADFTTVLAGYAAELEAAERQIAERWFRGTYGADRWEAEWAKAVLEVNYPTSFDESPFAEVLEQATAAQALPLGESPTFRTEHNARLIPQFLPDAPPDVVGKIRSELDALPTPEEERAQRLEEMAARFKAPGRSAAPPTEAA